MQDIQKRTVEPCEDITKNEVSIFWTGGYDSTFRICQLSRQNVIIQPYYLSDCRKSERNELEAIDSIRKVLLSNPNTKATINPLIYISKEERQQNAEIKKAFSILLKQDYMGSQYEWLGVFALEHKGIELSIHVDDKAISLIKKHGTLKKIECSYGSYYVIDKENSEPELFLLFGNQHFPLADYTKLQMKAEYSAMGLSDVIDKTWFCFTPIDGKPCGCCNPCKYTIEEGMTERFTKKALNRYKRRNALLFRKLIAFRRYIKRKL